jgi:DNA phosphorothioation-associated putative methyltransferase
VQTEEISIDRHKTAIRRNKLSKPVNLLLESNLLKKDRTFFDYGCGHGQDLQILEKNGFENINGYDPHYKPDAAKVGSDIVNLGFVLNVIEKPSERANVLKKSFDITKKVLCVSVMTKLQQGYEGQEYSDGVISSRGTFQKYYDQEEIKNYIESILDKDAIAVSPGVFFVFKEEREKLDYLQNRYKRAITLEVTRLDPITKKPTKVRVFRPKIEELIKESPFFKDAISFLINKGRVPQPEELDSYRELLNEYKSKRKINSLLLDNIDAEELESIRQERIQELLVFMAVRRFDRKGFPKQKDLPFSLIADIKEFFQNYTDLKKKAEELLFSIGSYSVMAKAFKQCTTGKVLPDAIYIHPSYIYSLPAPVQVKVEIARKLIGDIDECNLLKINKEKDKVSFLVYEDFDKVAHPALLYTMVCDIPRNNIKFWEFRHRENPPILHRKDTFVGEDYPHYDKFKKLTEKEEKAGLLGHNYIGTRLRWEEFVKESGFEIKGHQLKKLY